MFGGILSSMYTSLGNFVLASVDCSLVGTLNKDQPSVDKFTGSGFVVSDGLLVTDAHVVCCQLQPGEKFCLKTKI